MASTDNLNSSFDNSTNNEAVAGGGGQGSSSSSASAAPPPNATAINSSSSSSLSRRTPEAIAQLLRAQGGIPVTIQASADLVKEALPHSSWLPDYAYVVEGQQVGYALRMTGDDLVYVKFPLIRYQGSLISTAGKKTCSATTSSTTQQQNSAMLNGANVGVVGGSISSSSLAPTATTATASTIAPSISAAPIPPTTSATTTIASAGAENVMNASNSNVNAKTTSAAGSSLPPSSLVSVSFTIPKKFLVPVTLPSDGSIPHAKNVISAGVTIHSPTAQNLALTNNNTTTTTAASNVVAKLLAESLQKTGKDGKPLLCVVCGAWNSEGGQIRKSGFKCKNCIGKQSTARLKDTYNKLADEQGGGVGGSED